jgi:hypothetical protein
MAGNLTAMIASIFSGGVTADPYYEYTTLLLPGNGTNGAQNNTFLDSSSNNFTITRNGNTTQGTFSPFSQTGWGNYFDGSSYLANTSTTSVVAPGTSNFTAEFWVYATTDQQSQAYGSVLHIGSGTSGAWMVSLLYSSAGAMKIRVGTSPADYDSTSTISTNRWYHIALVREGTGSNQTKIYVDGSLFYTFTLSDNLSNSSALYIGTTGFNTSARRLSGYVSNVRLTVGTALYTGAFTPSTTPLTTTSQGAAATQVELLACQSNRFLDNSSNGWVFTTSGSPTVVAFSPFNPTASWSAATNGGSGYFDGSGDYLSVADNAAFTLGSGDFTVEAWVYKTTTGTQRFISAQCGSSGSNTSTSYSLGVTSSEKISGSINSGATNYAATSSNDCPLNAWTHIAFVRDGNTLRVYINGTQDGTASVTGVTVNDSSDILGIGSLGAYPSLYWLGYISNFRLVKGTCLYPSGTTFTPPTAPLTAITNTSLLLNSTNAGIYDATSKNDLETVGNAQLSNAVTPKWGSTSIYMAAATANTDYLVMPASRNVQLGSGDFTIEFWMRPDSVTTSWANSNLATMLDLDPSAGTGTDWWFIHQVNNTVQFGSNATTILTSSASLVATTWQYIALVRSGSGSNNLTFYINGTASGSATYTATIGGNRRLFIGTQQGSSRWYKGYLQDIRITPGVARTITTPTAAFPTL